MRVDPRKGTFLYDHSRDIFSLTLTTDKRVDLIDFFYHLSPASGRHKWSLIFNDWLVGSIYSSLAHLASVGVGVKPVITQCDLSFIRNMGGDSSNEFRKVSPSPSTACDLGCAGGLPTNVADLASCDSIIPGLLNLGPDTKPGDILGNTAGLDAGSDSAKRVRFTYLPPDSSETSFSCLIEPAELTDTGLRV